MPSGIDASYGQLGSMANSLLEGMPLLTEGNSNRFMNASISSCMEGLPVRGMVVQSSSR